MPLPRRYVVSVCSGPDCRGNGSDLLVPRLRDLLAARGLIATCRIKRGGCYGLCDQGANVIVREDLGGSADPLSAEDFELLGVPGEVHYAHMTSQTLEQVVDRHLDQGQPVEELRGKT